MKYIKNDKTKCTCSNPRHHAKWVLNEKGIVKSIESVLKSGDIEKLTKDTYEFVMNMSGFIAHTSHQGFMGHYENVEDLRKNLENSMDTADADRYITDKFFSESEQAEYYAQKTRILKNIKELVKVYQGNTVKLEEKNIENKVSLMAECVKRAQVDNSFAKEYLKSLSLL